MSDVHKPIVVSSHAAQRMLQRGATTAEVERTIREAAWRPAQRGKWTATARMDFNAVSPVNGQRYAYKTIDCVFADDPTAIVVVTVKVYYHN